MTVMPPLQSFNDFVVETRAMFAPPPYKPRFRFVRWGDLGKAMVKHEWLIKNLLTKGEKSVMGGASQTGKSFEATALGLCCARGIPYRGRKVAHCGVVYIAAESSQGVVARRLPAYRQHHGLSWEEDVPFVVITQAPDLYANDEDADALINDILYHASTFSVPLGLIILDTYSALTPGAKEIAAEDVSAVMRRIDRMREKTGAHVMIVHHMNADGTKLRGHTSFKANVDTVLEVSWVTTTTDNGKTKTKLLDADRREVRQIIIDKQKDGATGPLCRFVLKQVRLGEDEDGDPVTSCVPIEPAGQQENLPVETEQTARGVTRDGRLMLVRNEPVIFGALKAVLKAKGRKPPPHCRAPRDAECVTLADWRDELEKLIAGEEEDKGKLTERAKKARDRAVERFLTLKLIGKDGDWVWRTARLTNIDPVPRRRDAPPEQDEREEDVPFDGADAVGFALN